jgi:hypothetical protein
VFSARDTLRNCGLELPDTARLCEILQNNGVALPDGILTEDEFVEEIVKRISR